MKPMVAPLLVMAAFLSSISAAPPSDTPQNQAVVTNTFRVVFNRYDGDPKKPEGMTFQIQTPDLRQPGKFLKVGDVIPGTKIKLVSFQPKTKLNPITEELEDVSELKVAHTETGKTTVLILTRVTKFPDGGK